MAPAGCCGWEGGGACAACDGEAVASEVACVPASARGVKLGLTLAEDCEGSGVGERSGDAGADASGATVGGLARAAALAEGAAAAAVATESAPVRWIPPRTR